jgi:hypothetical protein
MQFILLSISLFFLAAPPEGRQTTSLIEWQTETDHDFGALQKDHPAWFAFKFKNISKAPIVIETVRTTCGCTAASWTEDAISPGETGTINIEYDAYHGGAFHKKIKVFFKEQRKAEALSISGEVN